jgi:8-oxo-dGTP pyrophosphatase MutT (NUDIX family)
VSAFGGWYTLVFVFGRSEFRAPSAAFGPVTFETADVGHVVLIRKLRPAWQYNKLNGIGGAVEPKDTTLDEAARREVWEEMGVNVSDLHRFGTLHHNGNRIALFHTTLPLALLHDAGAHTRHLHEQWARRVPDGITGRDALPPEPELTEVLSLDELEDAEVMPNLRWMIPMALSFARGEKSKGFVIHDLSDASGLEELPPPPPPVTREAFGHSWRRVWVEDDTTRMDPDAEKVHQAWKRLYNTAYPMSSDNPNAMTVPFENWGDASAYRLGNRMMVSAYDGHSLWELMP